jgi:hypothetical protein
MDKYFEQKIAYYKLWITIITAMDASIIAWFFNNYCKLSMIKYSFIWIIVLVFIIGTAVLNSKTGKLIDRLGEKNGY